MALDSALLTVKDSSESPYQLDRNQTLKASNALLKHIRSEAKRKEASSTTQNLLADANDSSDDASSTLTEPIWLVLTTKKHIVDRKKLKPNKIFLPHSLNTTPTSTICLFTADPQRPFKDTVAHPSFPSHLSSRITRVLGLSKLKDRYKSFETRRQLLAEHDVFLADARIITLLPKILGKTFYKACLKRPIPVNLQPSKSGQRDPASKKPLPAPNPESSDSNSARSIATPSQVAHEIERTLSCAQVCLSPAATTAVRVGLASFTPEQVAENVEVLVKELVERFVTRKWRNVRAIHIKGPNTMALPVWLAQELWVDDGEILEEPEANRKLEGGRQMGKRKRKEEAAEHKGGKGKTVANGGKEKKRKLLDEGLSAEMKERRAKLRKQLEDLKDDVPARKQKGEDGSKVGKPKRVKASSAT